MTNDKKAKKIRMSYQFFLKMQNEEKSFSIDDIAAATGWNSNSIKTYRTKKWSDILILFSNKLFYADVSRYTEEAYVRMMSQNHKESVEPFKPKLPEQVDELLVKARDSAILAVDIYNRPVVAFRSQGYIVMMIVAWTALLHAIYESDGKDYFYKNKDGTYKFVDKDKKAWELNTCLDNCGNIISDAGKINLRLFINLRNKIEHRHVPKFDIDIFGESQAMLLNFENLIVEKFGSYYALNNSLSFPLQVSSVRGRTQTEVLKKIQSEHYDELKKYINAHRSSLDESVVFNKEYSFRVFLTPQTANHRSSSDCAVEFCRFDPDHPEKFEGKEKDIVLTKEKHIPVANQGKFKPQMVCDALSKRMGIKIGVHLHTKAWKTYKVRGTGAQASGCNTKYCQYDEAHRDYIYTQEWIDFLFDKFKDEDELAKVKNQK